MTDALYCAPRDLYDHGLPRGSVPNRARVAAAGDATANCIELDEHGFDDDSPFQLRAEAGGSLPAPLVALTTYYAFVIDDNRFGARAAAGGAQIDLTTSGARIAVIAPLPISAAIEWASRRIDEMMPAHAVPMPDPVPDVIRMTCAELAAAKLMLSRGPATKSLLEIRDDAMKRIERWGKGVPMRGSNTPTRTNLAAAASRVGRDPLGWRRFGGIE